MFDIRQVDLSRRRGTDLQAVLREDLHRTTAEDGDGLLSVRLS